VEIDATQFSLPKDGNSERENEDAWDFAVDKSRFAVADGATETSFSGPWAKQLVRAFTKGSLSVPIEIEELEPLQRRWWDTIVYRTSGEEAGPGTRARRSLPWYAEEKAKDGAFAAFIGLELSNENSGPGAENSWQATAVGDSCLIHVRGNEILKKFPMTDSASFNNHPNLLSSTAGFNENEKDLIKTDSGSWRCHDLFLLMTDALACWFLKECEQGNSPWNILRDLDTDDTFKKLVVHLRTARQMKNDDVTLARIDIRA
jgi:hypothetical protein